MQVYAPNLHHTLSKPAVSPASSAALYCDCVPDGVSLAPPEDHSPTCAYHLRTLLLSGHTPPLPPGYYAALARKIGRSRHHTRRVVLGLGNPSREMFELVAGACGLSLDELKRVQEERVARLSG